MQTITSKGIYHGLPTYPDDPTGLTAIVCGANGISGDHMLRVLCESPKRWTKIFALSRRPPNKQWPSQIEHASMDFLHPPSELAAQLNEKNIKADHVFFFAYIRPTPKDGGSIWSFHEELVKLNTQLLQNFLTALTLTPSLPQTILLQQGVKYYGLHLGPTTVPQEETDPRIPFEPNFYYPQEDTLKFFAQEHNISWIITRPSGILGAVPDAAMNICLPLAIYASVQKHLAKPLEFPADLAAWETSKDLSSAQMNGYLAEWAVLSGNMCQSFNATDDCAFTWGKFWPRLAERFGVDWKGPDEGLDEGYTEMDMPCNPPPRGFGPPGKLRWKFKFSEWVQKKEVRDAWREIAGLYGLRQRELWDTDRIFGFVDAVIVWSYPMQLSTRRRKKLGFFGFVDSMESMFRVFDEFVDLKMIPPSG